jgi:EmrB/QacA subfamily drug resistance transporter
VRFVKQPRPSLVLLVVGVGVFLASLDLFIVNIAFPDLERDFAGTSLAGLSWVLNAYAVVFAALLVPAGRWADRAGRKRGFLFGLGLFVAASALCAAAPSVGVLVGARVVQAVGAAFMLPTSLGLLLPAFPPEKRAAAVGLWAAIGGTAAAAGPPIGGLLVQASWRWVFVINIPIGLAMLALGSRVLTEIRDAEGARPDVLGAGLLAGGVGALVAAIVQGPRWGWGSASTLALFAAALVLLGAVAWRSRSHPAPIIEPALVRIRSVAFANAGALLFFSGFGAMVLGTVLFLTGVWHESIIRAGLQIAPGPAMAATFAVPGGLLGARFGQRLVGLVGALLFAFAGVWWHTHLSATPDYAADFLPGMLISGAGVGLVLPSLSAAAKAPLPPSRFATGTAMLSMSRQIGVAVGVAILIAVVGTPAPGDAVSAFADAWTVIVACALAAGGLLALLGPVRVLGATPAEAPANA